MRSSTYTAPLNTIFTRAVQLIALSFLVMATLGSTARAETAPADPFESSSDQTADPMLWIFTN